MLQPILNMPKQNRSMKPHLNNYKLWANRWIMCKKFSLLLSGREAKKKRWRMRAIRTSVKISMNLIRTKIKALKGLKSWLAKSSPCQQGPNSSKACKAPLEAKIHTSELEDRFSMSPHT
jgi:hypothetical protein